MTTEEKAAFLGRYLQSEAETDRLMEEVQRWAAIATGATAVLQQAPARRRGVCESRTEHAVEHIILLQERLFEQVDALAGLYTAVYALIGTLPAGALRTVLRCRYLSGMSWETMAQKTGYCTRQLRRLHARALDALEPPPAAKAG